MRSASNAASHERRERTACDVFAADGRPASSPCFKYSCCTRIITTIAIGRPKKIPRNPIYPDFTHEVLPWQIDRTINFMPGL